MKFYLKYKIILVFIFIIFVIYFYFNKAISFETFTNVNDHDDLYCKIYNIVYNDKELLQSECTKIEKFLNNNNNNNQANKTEIIDAGCGVGNYYKYFNDKKYNIKGIDKSNNMIKYSKIKNPTGTFILNNLNDHSIFKPNTIDYILCMGNTLYQNNEDDIRKILSNFYYWLKPNGLLFITIYDENNLDPGPQPYSQYYTDKNGNKHCLTYYNKFTHDCWYEKNEEGITLNEKIILEDERSKEYKMKLNMYNKKEILNELDRYGFIIKDIILNKEYNINDNEIYCMKKIVKEKKLKV